MLIKINRALISVTDKTGLKELATDLARHNIEIISTGSTAEFLKDCGLNVQTVADYTGFPEILEGRVKTLHPLIYGGILSCNDKPEHVKTLEANNILPIDLVIVNLYKFTEAIQQNSDFETCIENIDIGGPSLIRAAAKNHKYKVIITDPKEYLSLQEELNTNNGATTYDFRRKSAANAFHITSWYDASISGWLDNIIGETFPDILNLSAKCRQKLRYGENPQQKAALYELDSNKPSIISATQLQGKELSYNNLNDADAALDIVREFHEPAAVIVKHTNPCGVASSIDINTAYKKALACDPVSAFGGVIALNRPIDRELANEMSKLFIEVIVAPGIQEDAKDILASKKNLRVLITNTSDNNSRLVIKSINGGFLVQTTDSELITSEQFKVVTKHQPSERQLTDLLFAFKVCKHVKSNSIVLAENESTIGIGAGQMSRVDSVKVALLKATDNNNFARINNAVLASDAFFPFSDSVTIAAEAGIKAVIQPGGSVRDDEVIKAANDHDITMVFTGTRHFKH